MTQPQYGYAPQQPGGYQTYDPNQHQYPQQPMQAPPAQYGQPNPYGQPLYGAPQGLGAYGQQPPVPQGPPLANGSLEDYFGQPSTGGGKGISWKGAPDGYTYQGVVARPVGDGDVFQDVDPQSKQPRFFRDGRPKLSMQVPLKLTWLDQMQQATFPDGEARLFVRGQLRDELTRAMLEAGAPAGAPEAGAFVQVTLTHRKPGNNIATNIFAVVYRSPGTWENGQVQQPVQQAPVAPTAPQQAPYQPQPAPAPVQGVQGYGQVAPNPQQYAQSQTPYPQQGAAPAPQYGQQAYDPNSAPVQGNPAAYNPNPQYQQAPAGTLPPQGSAPPQQYEQQQLPIPQQGQPPAQPPAPPVQAGLQQSALPPEKQALLARMQGQQQAPQG